MRKSLQKLDEKFFTQFNSVHRFKRKQLILWPEVEPSGVLFVKLGFIRQYLISKQGRELTVNILKPEAYFPIIWAFNNVENIYFYESLTDVTLLAAPKEKVIKQLQTHPDLLFDLTRRTLSGLEGLTKIMETLLTGSASQQIATVLLLLTKRFGKPSTNKEIIINLPLTHRLIGTIAGLSRESTSLELEELERNKIISKKNGLISVINIKKLEKQSLI